MSERVELNPPWPWASQFRIAQGVQVGNTVYVSGQVAFDPQGNLIGGNDMGAQSRQVFANIQAVLAEAGATMEDVVRDGCHTDTGQQRSACRSRSDRRDRLWLGNAVY